MVHLRVYKFKEEKEFFKTSEFDKKVKEKITSRKKMLSKEHI